MRRGGTPRKRQSDAQSRVGMAQKIRSMSLILADDSIPPQVPLTQEIEGSSKALRRCG